jgi:hypothetical protein
MSQIRRRYSRKLIHVPESVCEHDITTQQQVLDNRPHITMTNKTDKICLLIDEAIPWDRNVIQKEAENKLKHKNLSTQIQRMGDTSPY